MNSIYATVRNLAASLLLAITVTALATDEAHAVTIAPGDVVELNFDISASLSGPVTIEGYSVVGSSGTFSVGDTFKVTILDDPSTVLASTTFVSTGSYGGIGGGGSVTPGLADGIGIFRISDTNTTFDFTYVVLTIRDVATGSVKSKFFYASNPDLDFRVISAVPLPAGMPLVLTALGGLALLRHRRQRDT